MSAAASTSKAGLEGVVATSSAICYLDGDHGVLAYAGHDIHDLARRRFAGGQTANPSYKIL